MEVFSWEVLCDATERQTLWRTGLGKAGSGYTGPRPFSECDRRSLPWPGHSGVHSPVSPELWSPDPDIRHSLRVYSGQEQFLFNLTTSSLSQKPTQAAPSQHGPWAVSTENQAQHGCFIHSSSTICSRQLLSKYPLSYKPAHLAFTQ